jgi:hypothetical protein
MCRSVPQQEKRDVNFNRSQQSRADILGAGDELRTIL